MIHRNKHKFSATLNTSTVFHWVYSNRTKWSVWGHLCTHTHAPSHRGSMHTSYSVFQFLIINSGEISSFALSPVEIEKHEAARSCSTSLQDSPLSQKAKTTRSVSASPAVLSRPHTRSVCLLTLRRGKSQRFRTISYRDGKMLYVWSSSMLLVKCNASWMSISQS